MTFQDFHTERLVLRKMTAEDYLFILKTCTEEEQMHLLGFTSKEQLKKEQKRAEGGYTTFNKSFLVFQILPKSMSAVIGWCGFHTWYTDHDRAEVGYGLYSEEVKKKGYMTEALSFVLNYGFEEMGLQRIEGLVADYNIPSVRLLEKHGFVREGVLRKHYQVEGKMEDSTMYGLLKDEFIRH